MKKKEKDQKRRELLVLLDFWETNANKNKGTTDEAKARQKINQISSELAALG